MEWCLQPDGSTGASANGHASFIGYFDGYVRFYRCKKCAAADSSRIKRRTSFNFYSSNQLKDSWQKSFVSPIRKVELAKRRPRLTWPLDWQSLTSAYCLWISILREMPPWERVLTRLS